MIRGWSFFSGAREEKESLSESSPPEDVDDPLAIDRDGNLNLIASAPLKTHGELQETMTQSEDIFPGLETASLLSPHPTELSRFDLTTFLNIVTTLKEYVDSPYMSAEQNSSGHVSEADVKNAFSDIAEILVWADKNDSFIWETFLEQRVMLLIRRCLSTCELKLKRDFPAVDHASEGTFDSSSLRKNLASYIKTPDSPFPASSRPSSSNLRDGNDSRTENMNASCEQAVVDFQAHILQTLAVIIHNVNSLRSLYYLFSGDHINSIIEFDFAFYNDEVLGYFISALRGISLKLDETILQFFLDPTRPYFPLYTTAVRFFDHSDEMIRIAVRNITLSVFSVTQSESVLTVLEKSMQMPYFEKLFRYISGLFDSVLHPLEVLLDDGSEIPRTRQRTGLFRKNVQASGISLRLTELENLLLYIKDLYALLSAELQAEIRRLFDVYIFRSIFKPLAAQASLNAVVAPSSSWTLRFSRQQSGNHKLFTFDAAARTMLLTFVMTTVGKSRLSECIVAEVQAPHSNFEGRSILHALKAMAYDLTGTERVTYMALRALEVLMEWKVLPMDSHSPSDTNSLDVPEVSVDNDEHSTSAKEDITHEQKLDELEIVTIFRTGESSLRDGLSSILLVSRKRDVRTLRVVETVGRLILNFCKGTNSFLSLDMSSMILNDIVSRLRTHVSDERTTIVAIERAFTSYREASENIFSSTREPDEDQRSFTSLKLVHTASLKPRNAGRVRRPVDNSMAPIEFEDAVVFYCIARVHEKAFRGANEGAECGLCKNLQALFDGAQESSSYLEKRDLLHELCNAVLGA